MSRQELIDKEAAEYTIHSEIFKAGVKFAETHFPWHKTSEEVPEVKGTSEEGCIYPEVCCLVAGGRMANTPSGIGIRYWNVTEQCWDTEDEDDYDCDEEGYPYWAYADPILEQTPNEGAECNEVMDREKKNADSKKELAHFDADIEEAEITVDISKMETTIVQQLPDDILIDKLRNRGYKGKVTKNKEVEL